MTPDAQPGYGLSPGRINISPVCSDAARVSQSLYQLEKALGYGPAAPGADPYYPVVQDDSGNIIGGGVGARPVNIILAKVNQLGGVPPASTMFDFVFLSDLYGTSGMVGGSNPSTGRAKNTSMRSLQNQELVKLVTYDNATWLADKMGENVIVARVSQAATTNDPYIYFTAQYAIAGVMPEATDPGVILNVPASDYAANEEVIIELTDATTNELGGTTRLWRVIENEDAVGSGGEPGVAAIYAMALIKERVDAAVLMNTNPQTGDDRVVQPGRKRSAALLLDSLGYPLIVNGGPTWLDAVNFSNTDFVASARTVTQGIVSDGAFIIGWPTFSAAPGFLKTDVQVLFHTEGSFQVKFDADTCTNPW